MSQARDWAERTAKQHPHFRAIDLAIQRNGRNIGTMNARCHVVCICGGDGGGDVMCGNMLCLFIFVSIHALTLHISLFDASLSFAALSFGELFIWNHTNPFHGLFDW